MLTFQKGYSFEHKVHEVMFGRSFCMNSNSEIHRRSGIQSKFWTAAILRETTDKKIEEKKEER